MNTLKFQQMSKMLVGKGIISYRCTHLVLLLLTAPLFIACDTWKEMSIEDARTFLETNFTYYPEMTIVKARRLEEWMPIGQNKQEEVQFSLPDTMHEADWLAKIALDMNTRFTASYDENIANGWSPDRKNMVKRDDYFWELEDEDTEFSDERTLKYEQQTEYFVAYRWFRYQ